MGVRECMGVHAMLLHVATRHSGGDIGRTDVKDAGWLADLVRHRAAACVASLGGLTAKLLDHGHDSPNCGLWLVKLDVVSTLLGNHLVTIG